MKTLLVGLAVYTLWMVLCGCLSALWRDRNE